MGLESQIKLSTVLIQLAFDSVPMSLMTEFFQKKFYLAEIALKGRRESHSTYIGNKTIARVCSLGILVCSNNKLQVMGLRLNGWI